jgi:hypothetical protein
MPQYYEQDSFFPTRRSRVDEEGFGSINFGAQDDYGQPSLTDWQYQAEQAAPRSNPMASFMDSLRGAYGKTPALDTYRKYLSQSPDAADYAPTKWDRLAAGLGGISAGLKDPAKGIQVAQGMNRSRYDTALKDYYAQAAPLKEAAGIEREGMQDRVKALLEGQERQQKYMDYVRNLSKDERDYLIATGKLKVDQETLGLNERKFGHDVTNDQRDYELAKAAGLSLADYRKQQTGIGWQNANTAASSAASAAAERENNIFWDNMTGGGSRAPRPPSANEAGTAQVDVMRDLAPKYPTIIVPDASGENLTFAPPPPVGTPEYNMYRQVQEEVAGRANARARSGQVTFGDYGDAAGAGGPMNFGGSYNPNPPPSLPNFGPSQNQRRGGRRYGPQ